MTVHVDRIEGGVSVFQYPTSTGKAGLIIHRTGAMPKVKPILMTANEELAIDGLQFSLTGPYYANFCLSLTLCASVKEEKSCGALMITCQY
jgi:hypothetical protein